MSTIPVSSSELESRHENLRRILARENVKLLILTAIPQIGDKRGKGCLKYLFGYNLNSHRIAYGVFPLEGTPYLIFPNGVSHGALGLPKEMYRSAKWQPVGTELEKSLQESSVKQGDRIGVVGFDEQMHIQDYVYLTRKFPGVEFYEAIDLLEEVRSVKTQTEIDHLRESNAIAEEGFEVLMQQVKNGARIRDLAISVFDEIFRNGSHFYDTSVLALWGSGGQAGPYFLLPDSDYKLKPDDMFIFSLELAGPGGYWVELSRIFCTGRPSSIGKSLSEAAMNSLENAANWLVPGQTAGDVYEALDKPIRSVGFKQGHQPGHGLGTDILESPKIREGQKNVIKENMAIALHPHVLNADSSAASYLANTYVVSSVSSQPLSKVPLDIILTQ